MNTFINPFCISAFVICKNLKKTPYLLIRRCSAYLPGTWQMVSGGVHEGEKTWETALREIKEETGLVPTSIYSADAIETFYYPPKDAVVFVPVFVATVDNPGHVALSPNEHDAYEWVSLDEALNRLVWAEQRRVIKHIHDLFVLREPNKLLKIF